MLVENSGNPTGRPSKLTDETALAIALMVEEGNYLHCAAAAVGISKQTLHRWMATGKQFPDGQYGIFRDLVIKAKASWEASAVSRINHLAKDDGKLLLEILARRSPTNWSKHTGELTRIRQELRELVREVARLEAIRDSEAN